MLVYANGAAHLAVSCSPLEGENVVPVVAAWSGLTTACDDFGTQIDKRFAERAADRRVTIPMEARVEAELRAGALEVQGTRFAFLPETAYYLCDWSWAYDRGVWCEVSRDEWLAHTTRILRGMGAGDGARFGKPARAWDTAY
jgi:hypothetical protein